jgi:transcriptional regulator with XRE-family HTH domain
VQIPNLRRLRELHGLTQKELADVSGVSLRSVAGYEGGAHARPNTARKLAEALNVEVADLVGADSYPKAQAPPSPTQPPLNGLRLTHLEEERLISRFAEAIIAAAASWGKAMANPDMSDSKRLGLIDAALTLSDVINERVQAEDLEAIPTIEQLEIMHTMGKLGEATDQGLRHLKESGEARDQEEQVKQRREQMRELTRRISA